MNNAPLLLIIIIMVRWDHIVRQLSSFYLDGKERSGERCPVPFLFCNPVFGDSTAQLLIGVKRQERLVDR